MSTSQPADLRHSLSFSHMPSLYSRETTAECSELNAITPPSFSISDLGSVLGRLTITKPATAREKMANAIHHLGFLNLAIMILRFSFGSLRLRLSPLVARGKNKRTSCPLGLRAWISQTPDSIFPGRLEPCLQIV